jgi:phytoene dehydrogenase-like protein
MNHVDVIVVGSGIAGLTATAYLSKENLNVLLMEKEAEIGGLLGSFNVDGHVLDKGARSIIDSGIVIPMLRQLNIDIDFVPNPIKITIGSQSVNLSEKTDIDTYGSMLKHLYPDNQRDIDVIIADIKTVMKTMDVMYGIENPLFISRPYEMSYVTKSLLPWVFRFVLNIRKMSKMMDPINDFLRRRTSNESLIYIITQHFFSMTPTFFALSYFTLYMQYHYPKGSTQTIVDQLKSSILSSGGTIMTNQEVIRIDVENKQVTTKQGQVYCYDQLLWAADTNRLYQTIDRKNIQSAKLLSKIEQKIKLLENKTGADSVLTVYILTDLSPQTFENVYGPHCFYTPRKESLATVKLDDIKQNGKFIEDKQKLFDWISRFIEFNTLEISIPVLRDRTLSPQGQTGLIVSILFDYELVKHFEDMKIYDEFKHHITALMIKCVSTGMTETLSEHILKTVVSTPLYIARKTYNTQGSLTGWSFANKPFPTEYRFIRLAKSVLTPSNSIKQAGQWTFNPAGVPVSILTGKLAADAIIKDVVKSISKKKGGSNIE